MESRVYASSPFRNVLQFIPSEDASEFKSAIYNSVVIILLFTGASIAWAVYHILEPFFKPLLWAVLFGSVLYPIKASFTARAKAWISNLKTTNSSVILGLWMLPINAVDSAMEFTVEKCLKYFKITLGIFIGLPASYYVYDVLISLHSTASSFCSLIQLVIGATLSNFVVVLTVVLGYVVVLYFVHSESSAAAHLITLQSYVTLVSVIGYLSSWFGSWQAVIFLIAVILLIAGYFEEHTGYSQAITAKPKSVLQYLLDTCLTFFGNPQEGNEVVRHLDSSSDESVSSGEAPVAPSSSQTHYSDKSHRSDIPHHSDTSHHSALRCSNTYLYGVLWACFCMTVWRHSYLFNLVPLIVVYILLKYIILQFALLDITKKGITALLNTFYDRLSASGATVIPSCLFGARKILYSIDRYVLHVLETYMNTAVTVLVILIMMVLTVLIAIFAVMQIHSEGMHIVHVTNNFINSTVINNPDIQELLPDNTTNWFNSFLDSAYVYGRENMRNFTHNFIGDDTERTVLLEKQILEFWDRVYQSWMTSSINSHVEGPHVTEKAVSLSWQRLKETVVSNFELSQVTAVLRENLDTIMSVLDSFWVIVKGNFGVAFNVFTVMLSVLLSGGTAIINFLLCIIVFLTSMFYLLSTSGKYYKPVELCSRINVLTGGKGLVESIEDAVNGVFFASAKMALFYGMWTWLIHVAFQVNFAFLPSMLAALFATVPFVGTYWAAAPAVIELWWVRQNHTAALLLFLCQLLPMSIVDTVIYSEIQGGGHPYLTALAVAGGIFYFGAEGAIFGPVLLACFFVAVRMYSNIMKSSESTVRQRGRVLRSQTWRE